MPYENRMKKAENCEGLRQKANQLMQEEEWDALIPVLTELIVLVKKDSAKALLHANRGTAYYKKGDYNKAIADLDRAIELNPDDEVAYCSRGVFHGKDGNHVQAIADLGKAIELKPDFAQARHSRGVAHISMGNYKAGRRDYEAAMGNYEAAIVDLEKAIDLDPENALAYQNCAFAYRHIGQHERAIKLVSRAIRLSSANAPAYRERGSAYLLTGHYGKALDDFVRANKHDPKATLLSSGMYVAVRIDNMYGASEKRQRNKAFKFFYKLVDAVRVIQERLFCGPENVQEIAHYTTLYALRSLVQKSPFRLSNGAYMNDPEEGRTFFEIMADVHDMNVRDRFYQKNPPHPSPAYIGSFTKLALDGAGPKDKLFLWRTYGKHDAEEAAGVCLIFRNNGRNFAEELPPRMGYMPQLTIDVTSQQIPKPALYRVVYRNDKGDMSEELSKELSQLSESLEQIEAHVLRKANGKGEQLRSIACELLDSIRFLFKKDHYKEEQEVRIIEARRAGDEETWESDGVKVDAERIPPRFYLEAGNLRFSEVILGPKTRGILEWTRWLKEQDEELTVKKSGIEYGERHL